MRVAKQGAEHNATDDLDTTRYQEVLRLRRELGTGVSWEEGASS